MLTRNPAAPAPGASRLLKRSLSIVLGLAAIAATTACVVAPGPYRGGGASVYVAPTYASPGLGWAWENHPSYGWGWHHPDHGWHQGWR